MQGTSSKQRTVACVECNKRKIRCESGDGWEESGRCEACNASGVECFPCSRKKRKLVSVNARAQSQSSERILESQLQANGDHTLPYQYWGSATGQWAAASQLAIEAEGPQQTTSNSFIVSGKQNTTETETYIGRSHYLAHDLSNDEGSARAYRASKDKGRSEIELKTLALWDCSLLPPKAVRQSLIDTFMHRCYPWTPVLSPEDVEIERQGKLPSLLLN